MCVSSPVAKSVSSSSKDTRIFEVGDSERMTNSCLKLQFILALPYFMFIFPFNCLPRLAPPGVTTSSPNALPESSLAFHGHFWVSIPVWRSRSTVPSCPAPKPGPTLARFRRGYPAVSGLARAGRATCALSFWILNPGRDTTQSPLNVRR